MDITPLVDSWALALTHDAAPVVDQRATDTPIAVATAVSRRAFGDSHSKKTANALIPLLDTAQARDPQALTSRQLHVLTAIAAADLLGPDQLAAFLDSYIEPGVDIWYQPVSVSALRRELHTVLGPYPAAKRLSLLTSLAERNVSELYHWAEGQQFSPEVYALALRDADEQVRKTLAADPQCAPEDVATLAADPASVVRATVARRPDLDSELEVALAADAVLQVRLAVARREDLNPGLVYLLSADDEPAVVGTMLRRPDLPASITARLIDGIGTTTHPQVLHTLAKRPDLTVAQQRTLVRTGDPRILLGLAENPQLGPKVLRRLLTATQPHVRESMWANVTGRWQLERERVRELKAVRRAIAERPELDPALQPILLTDAHTDVRRALVGNPDLVPELQPLLAADPDEDVRITLAQRADLLPELQPELIRTSPGRVTLHVLAREDLTIDAQRVALRGRPDSMRNFAIYARSIDPAVQRWIVDHRTIEPDALIELARRDDLDVEIACAIAGNPNPEFAAARVALVTRTTPLDPAVREVFAADPTMSEHLAVRSWRDGATARRTVEPPPAAQSTEGPTGMSAMVPARSYTDPHARYRIALGRGTPEQRMVPAPAVERLAEASTAIGAGARVSARQVKDAQSLPGLDSLAFPTFAAAQARFAEAAQHDPAIARLGVRVLPTGTELRQNGIEMSNCTLSDMYVDACRSGRTIVVHFTVDDEPYNVAWVSLSGDGRWSRRDLAGHDNATVSPEVQRIADRLEAVLDGLEPDAPAAELSTAARDAMLVELAPVGAGLPAPAFAQA